MKLKPQTNTQVAVTYHACTYNTVPAQYTDLAVTASTVNEECSVRYIWHDLVHFGVLEKLLFFTNSVSCCQFLFKPNSKPLPYSHCFHCATV